MVPSLRCNEKTRITALCHNPLNARQFSMRTPRRKQPGINRLNSLVHEAPRRDVYLLIAARTLRMFGAGVMSVVLVLYLVANGITPAGTGFLITAGLVVSSLLTLRITTLADRVGRRRALLLSTCPAILAAVILVGWHSAVALSTAVVVGFLPPASKEVGPFQALEQAALASRATGRSRTKLYAVYNMAGMLAAATGAFAAGGISLVSLAKKAQGSTQYHPIMLMYLAAIVISSVVYLFISPHVEPQHKLSQPRATGRDGLSSSRKTVAVLSSLFAMDAFGGGLVLQSYIAYWFHIRFGASVAVIGSTLFGANLLAGISALAAAAISNRIGLVNTMVFTHVPSNVLLMLVPLMPNLSLAILVLMLRFSISQMDVPTRQAFLMAAVQPEERSAAAGITGVARTAGSAAAPSVAGVLLNAYGPAAIPFLAAGAIKIIYDLLILARFGKVELREHI